MACVPSSELAQLMIGIGDCGCAKKKHAAEGAARSLRLLPSTSSARLARLPVSRPGAIPFLTRSLTCEPPLLFLDLLALLLAPSLLPLDPRGARFLGFLPLDRLIDQGSGKAQILGGVVGIVRPGARSWPASGALPSPSRRFGRTRPMAETDRVRSIWRGTRHPSAAWRTMRRDC
jgi:hypothetical protein